MSGGLDDPFKMRSRSFQRGLAIGAAPRSVLAHTARHDDHIRSSLLFGLLPNSFKTPRGPRSGLCRDSRPTLSLASAGHSCPRVSWSLPAGGRFLSTESATILFTDQVGSTELSQRLSPEAADEVRQEHFSLLRQAIAETGG